MDAPDFVCLNTFFDALQTRRACEFLEEDGIGFEVRDRTIRVQGASRFHEGPAILMEVFVNADDVQRAQSCLRRTMQLFPEREIVSISDDELREDDEVLSEAFACDEQNDAVAASSALSEVGIWSSVHEEADEDGKPVFMVEVKSGDIERAIAVVNRWLDSR